MADDKDVTGTSDTTYNLVSALYHCLEGAKTYSKYLEDAKQSGDENLIDFFRNACFEEAQRADVAKRLLAAELGKQSSA